MRTLHIQWRHHAHERVPASKWRQSCVRSSAWRHVVFGSRDCVRRAETQTNKPFEWHVTGYWRCKRCGQEDRFVSFFSTKSLIVDNKIVSLNNNLYFSVIYWEFRYSTECCCCVRTGWNRSCYVTSASCRTCTCMLRNTEHLHSSSTTITNIISSAILRATKTCHRRVLLNFYWRKWKLTIHMARFVTPNHVRHYRYILTFRKRVRY